HFREHSFPSPIKTSSGYTLRCHVSNELIMQDYAMDSACYPWLGLSCFRFLFKSAYIEEGIRQGNRLYILGQRRIQVKHDRHLLCLPCCHGLLLKTETLHLLEVRSSLLGCITRNRLRIHTVQLRIHNFVQHLSHFAWMHSHAVDCRPEPERALCIGIEFDSNS